MALAQLGDRTRALSEVEAVAASSHVDGQCFYNAACIYSFASQLC